MTPTNHRHQPPLRRARCLAALLAAAAAVGWAPVPKPRPAKPDPVKEELRRLQGAWVRVSLNVNGRPAEVTPGEQEVFEGDRLASVSGKVVIRSRVSLAPSKAPKWMDIRGDRQGFRCIYKLEGDTLTLCFFNRDGAKGRPADFKPRPGVCVEVLKRAKPKPKSP